MLPDRVSNPGPLTYESGALPIALRGPAGISEHNFATIGNFYMILSIIKEQVSAECCIQE